MIQNLDLSEKNANHISKTQSWTHFLLFVLSAFAIGMAVQISNGAYHPRAMRWLTLSLCFLGAPFFLKPISKIEKNGENICAIFLLILLAQQFFTLFTNSPAMYLAGSFEPYFFAGVFFAVLVLMIAQIYQRNEKVFLLIIVAIHFGISCLILYYSPHPAIDVFDIHQTAIKGLLGGSNPYTLVTRNIYGTPDFFGEGLVKNGFIQIGFPYPPLSLFFSTMGHFLGDFRIAHALGMSATAVFIFALAPGRFGLLLSSLLLFSPRSFFVIEQSWTEPLVTACFGLVLYLSKIKSKYLWLGLGLFFSVKQYAILLAPLVCLLNNENVFSKKNMRLVLYSGLAAFFITAPLAFWNISSFLNDVLFFQIRQPFRRDALSYLAAAERNGFYLIPRNVAFYIFFATLIGLGIRKFYCRKEIFFAHGASLLFFLFFIFNKQAFCNYYYAVMAMTLMSAASAFPSERV